MHTQEPRETEQSRIDQAPSSETVDVQRFFPGGNRQAILDELLSTIASAVSIVTLTGDEGSGKTMMCRMVEKKITPDYVTVFFLQAVDSFEDVVRIIARRLEVETSVATGDIPSLLQAIASTLKERGTRLLIIFDEAERIYLATLERVRKMLDQVNSSGQLLQIVLSGRSGLHNNFKNLALCNFLEVEERHFALPPLDRQETFAYLNHVMQVEEQGDKQTKFPREAAEKIFSVSRGNFRLINSLAKDSLQTLESAASFAMAHGNVREVEEKTKPRRRLKPATTKKSVFNKRKLAWGGGVVCAVLVVFLLMRSGRQPDMTSVENSLDTKNKIVISQPESIDHLPEHSEETPSPNQIDQEPVEKKALPLADTTQLIEPDNEKTAVQVESVKPVEPEKEKPVVATESVQSVEPKKEEQVVQVEKEQPVAPEQEQPVAPVEKVKLKEPKIEAPVISEKASQPVATETNNPVAQEVQAQPSESKQEEPVTPVKVVQLAEPDKNEAVPVVTTSRSAQTEVEKTVAPVVSIKAKEIVKYRDRKVANAVAESPPKPIQRIEQEENKIAELTAVKPVKIKPALIKERAVQASQAAPGVEKAEEPKVIKAETATVKESSKGKNTNGGEKLYSSRITAGTPWLLGLKDNRYTVQLMVITDSDDEKKLKKMLAQDNFKGQANKIYILRKESTPDVKYVFYGEYPTMTDARNARNTIPEFLRGNKPYAMSVKGAVKKVQEDE